MDLPSRPTGESNGIDYNRRARIGKIHNTIGCTYTGRLNTQVIGDGKGRSHALVAILGNGQGVDGRRSQQFLFQLSQDTHAMVFIT
jgi:hypothetical protein